MPIQTPSLQECGVGDKKEVADHVEFTGVIVVACPVIDFKSSSSLAGLNMIRCYPEVLIAAKLKDSNMVGTSSNGR